MLGTPLAALPRRLRRLAAGLALAVAVLVLGGQAPPPLVPSVIELDPAVAAALEAEWLTDEERRALRVFHGVWDDADLVTPEARAMVALNAWALDDPVFDDPAVPDELRAEARLRRGALDAVLPLLDGAGSNRAARLRAEALEGLGRLDDAAEAVRPAVRRLRDERLDDAAELVEGVRALVVRARVQGQPARDFQTMMDLLGRARQQLDRLYWPARLVEAELLLDKDNADEAVTALHETLRQNPRCARVWYDLGLVAIDRFDFASAARAADTIARANRDHPLAALLRAESALIQNDPERALEELRPLLDRYPRMRRAQALLAATHARRYDPPALRAALARFDEISPGSALAHYVVGKHLAYDRQYGEAAEMLEEACRRQPAWPRPQIELGLLELQSGRDDQARRALERVAELDPFNKRAANSLFLLEEMADNVEIESEHFIVRYEPGVDAVFAELMPPVLERIHAVVSERFGHEPDRRTVIEVLPDHQRFGVRITGMPFIHTIAACTGPVIALEVPREGAPHRHLGLFDWPRVLQHEYTHTITLSQTRNRIPHWLTEAAAVSMELAPRDYRTWLMLARAYHLGELFTLDQISWAFIRPKRAGDRGLAYAQGHWMVEHMNERFGDSALVRLLAEYREGRPERVAIPNALGVTPREFYEGFLAWAGDQLAARGLAPSPTLTELKDEVIRDDPDLAVAMAASVQARLDVIVKARTARIGQPSTDGPDPLPADEWPPLVRPDVKIDDALIARWLEAHPDHPDVHEARVRRALRGVDARDIDDRTRGWLVRYHELRPDDPFPHKVLAKHWLARNEAERAIESLEFLDRRAEKKPVYALRLAELYRERGDDARALEKAMRAVHISPYDAASRELAAALAITAGDLDLARTHIVALTLLEPERPQHRKRLEAIDQLIARRG